jgi:Tfp pilus assembly protein PilV
MVNSNINSNVNRTGNNSARLGNNVRNGTNNLSRNVNNGSSNNSGKTNSKGVKNTLSDTFSNVTSFFGGDKKNNSKANGNSNSNSKGNSNANNSDKSSTMFIIIAVVLLVIVLGVAGYFVHRYMKQKNPSELSTKQFIPYIHDASIDKRISNGSIPQSSDGNEYNINFWIYVNDYTVNKDVDKCIIYRGETPEGTLNNASVDASGGNPNISCNPGVWLLKNVNTLRIIVGLETNYNQSNCETSATSQACQSGAQDVDVCEIQNFPLQRWVNVNITMRNNVIDVFFDGLLKKSCILKGFPLLSNNDMLICPDGGFNGYISNMKYSNKAVAVSKIEAMYKSGPTL